MSQPDSSPHSVLDEVAAELEYLMSAAERPGTISHHDAEDAEARLLAHVRGLEEQLQSQTEDFEVERTAMHNVIQSQQGELHELQEQYEDLQRVAGKAVGDAAAWEAENRGLKEQLETAHRVIDAAALELTRYGKLTDHAAGHDLITLADSIPASAPAPAVTADGTAGAGGSSPACEHVWMPKDNGGSACMSCGALFPANYPERGIAGSGGTAASERSPGRSGTSGSGIEDGAPAAHSSPASRQDG